MPMVLAAIFVITAAMFAGMAIKRKEDRKVTSTVALVIELISFTIWLPSLNDLFNVIGLTEEIKQIAMLISIILILLGTAVAIVFNVRQEET